MAVLKNCRNCAHADWSRTAKGRINPNRHARCNAPLPSTSQLAISAYTVRSAIDYATERRPSVASYGNKPLPIECPAWQKAVKP